MHPRLEHLSRLVEANKNREIAPTQLWLNQNELLFSSPSLIAILVEIQAWAHSGTYVVPTKVDEIIEKHLGVTHAQQD